jgi:ActR/RegA family two-component response regulator
MQQDTILLVDDESSVRQTVREWLTQAQLDCQILTASDAESALRTANEHPIDLAILDWNLGSGDDGLQLLQDLAAFHPDIVAIMITGFANMATPLDAMRMGVRDYLDKNHDFSREALVRSVRKQLDQLRPAKRGRQLHQSLITFRDAVEQIIPLVQQTAALNDPVPLPDAVRGLVRFVMLLIRAHAGILLVRHYDADRTPPEVARIYGSDGQAIQSELVPFAQSVAGAALSRGEPCVMNELGKVADGPMQLQPFERSHRHLLAVPMAIAPGIQVVLELFDKQNGFGPDDQEVARAAADLGTELLRQALGQRRTHQVLFDAVAAALRASDHMAESLGGRPKGEPPPKLLDQLRAGLSEQHEDPQTVETSLRLAEAIRGLSASYGPVALEHCLQMVQLVRQLLDRTTAG